MGQVSQFEVDEERRNDAVRLNLLPVLPKNRGRRVYTGLETTQNPSPKETRLQRQGQSRIRSKQTCFNKWAANNAWLPSFIQTLAISPDDDALKPLDEPVRHHVVVVVERVVHQPFFGSPEIWLKIQKRNDHRLSLRPPNFSDWRALSAKYPGFFSVWSNEPSTAECLAEWCGKEWALIEIFNPWVDYR